MDTGMGENVAARFHPLRPGFRIAVVAPPPLPEAIVDDIDRLWESEKARRGERLFDGPVHLLLGPVSDTLTFVPMRYRHSLAVRRRPDLRAALGMRPAGVIGLVSCRDGVLFGLRAQHVAAPGRWEPAPAGTLDRPAFEEVLFGELAEELGLDAEDVDPPTPLTVVEDVANGVVDVIYRVTCPLDAAAVHHAHATAPSRDEYDTLAIVAPGDLPRFLRAETARLRPVVGPLLQVAGYEID